MRGLVAVVVALAVASFSGCVELVGEEDPDLQAAADEAAQALEEHRTKVGHISGQVVGADGVPLAGALVDLVTVAQVKTDEAGRFSFLDLTPGEYSLAAEATDHLSSSVDLDVRAGQYTRPRIELEVAPEQAYFTTYQLDGYSEPGFIGTGNFLFSCDCYLYGEIDPEGLVEVLIEGQTEGHNSPFGSSYGFNWQFEAAGENESSYQSDYSETPMRVSIAGEDIAAGAQEFYGYFEPASSLVDFGEAFTVFVTLFYYEGAAEDYTAFAQPE